MTYTKLFFVFILAFLLRDSFHYEKSKSDSVVANVITSVRDGIKNTICRCEPYQTELFYLREHVEKMNRIADVLSDENDNLMRNVRELEANLLNKTVTLEHNLKVSEKMVVINKGAVLSFVMIMIIILYLTLCFFWKIESLEKEAKDHKRKIANVKNTVTFKDGEIEKLKKQLEEAQKEIEHLKAGCTPEQLCVSDACCQESLAVQDVPVIPEQ